MLEQSDRPFEPSQKGDDLWSEYLEGRQYALGRIFLKHYSRLYRYGVRLVQNESAVQDSIQELFLKLWEKRTEINKAHSVEFYLLHSLRRILLRQKEQINSFHRRNREYMQEVPQIFRSAEKEIILEEVENERYQLFLKAQQSLTCRQKEILYLRLQQGLTNAEISDFLNISKQRVKNCMYESIKLLKERIYYASVEGQV